MGRGSLLQDLRFDEERVHAEQLRLLLGNVISSTLPVMLLGMLMVFILSNEHNLVPLLLWFLMVMTAKLASYIVARHALAGPITFEGGRNLARMMIGFYLLNGLGWGALPWLTLDTASTAGRVITLAVMAGVIGSAMAQTSSILAVFVAFAGSTLILVAFKLLMLGDPTYTTFALATILYFFLLLSLSRNNAAAALASIKLRFENSELLQQLRFETEMADAARRDAEHANMAKSKFLAAASHDLRQPVHAQGLFLTVLAGTELNPQQRELVENIRKASETSSEMLETLLDFSRIEAGVIQPQVKTFALQPLLYKLEAELAPQADARGLIYRTRDTSLSVHSDPALLELILRNLISNAIRYTEQGGILVGVRRRGGQALLEVWDTGIGIDSSQQREVFREFHQLGNPERDSRKGLGLGLAIADGLAGVLGHGLSLSSQPARGSVFRVRLELAQGVLLDGADTAPLRTDGPMRLAVLVIDDEESIRKGMQQLMNEWGCSCMTAEGIEEALQVVEAWRPDVIISDYRLREQRTGAEAIFAVRERMGEDTPALIITGDTAVERLREAQASGIALMHKPLSPNLLYGHLHRLAERGGDSAAERGHKAG